MKQDNNGTLYLGIDDILENIKSLARSQGFYGRLYERLIEVRDNDADAWDEVVSELEAQKFRTALDMVFYFEC